MTEEGHREAAAELRTSRTQLDRVRGIRLYSEASFGMAQHLIAAGAERRYGVHSETHLGLARWLREHGEDEMAECFAELEQMRTGRWYGRQGNGATADRQDKLLDAITTW